MRPRYFSSPLQACQKNQALTNTQRLLQFHEKGSDPPGVRVATPGSWFTWAPAESEAATDPRPINAPLNALNWTIQLAAKMPSPMSKKSSGNQWLDDS